MDTKGQYKPYRPTSDSQIATTKSPSSTTELSIPKISCERPHGTSGFWGAPQQGRGALRTAFLGCVPFTSRQGAPWLGRDSRPRGGRCGARSSPGRCQVYGTELPGRTRGGLTDARIPFA